MLGALSLWSLFLFGLYLFARGFFPLKPLLPSSSPIDFSKVSITSEPTFTKLVVMLVDALREDFIFGNTSGFHFTQSYSLFFFFLLFFPVTITLFGRLIKSGKTKAFIARATAPTVTMPRIKALTTGSTPNFLDVALNFDAGSSSLSSQDSWVHRMKESGKLIRFFGDDTWLKLFPTVFDSFEGTSSFFVSDTVEVDNNVTRHVGPELERRDWDVLIFHYLGLDHIGHLSGPKSPLMRPKQEEMDTVAKTIYETIVKQDENEPNSRTLFLLCGDHGMNDMGNHGGSSYGEVSTAFVFMSSEFSKNPLPNSESIHPRTVEQTDLVPTLALLYNLGIPRNSIGKIIPEMFTTWTEAQYKQAVRANAEQLAQVLLNKHGIQDAKKIEKSACEENEESPECLLYTWANAKEAKTKNDLEKLEKFMESSTLYLSRSFSDYDVTKMYIGVVIMACASALFWHSFSFGITFYFLGSQVALPLIMSVALFGSVFSSSFVEEEHELWYFWMNTFTFLLIYFSFCLKKKSAILSSICMACINRIWYAWSQTGNKHAGEPDIRAFLAKNPVFEIHGHTFNVVPVLFRLAVAVIFGLYISKSFRSKSYQQKIGYIGLVAYLLRNVYANLSKYKLQTVHDPVLLARDIYTMLAGGALLDLVQVLTGAKSIMSLPASLFFVLLSRTYNAPLVAMILVHMTCFEKVVEAINPKASVSLAVSYLIMLQHLSFYAFGNSNSIATIDLSNAYVGLDDYQFHLTGLLTFLSNWAGPLLVLIRGVELLKAVTPSSQIFKSALLAYVFSGTAFRFVFMVALSISCIIMRHHLFIWSVFSPKYLYEVAWIVSQFCVIIYSSIAYLTH